MRDFYALTNGESEPTANELASWREARITSERRLAPRHPAMAAYAAAHGLGSVGEGPDGQGPTLEAWDPEQHGTREEVEAAVEAWATERAAAAEEAARAEAKRAEEEAAAAETLRAEREAAAAKLEEAAAVVQAALAAGKLDGPEVAEAYATIALAGAARLRT